MRSTGASMRLVVRTCSAMYFCFASAKEGDELVLCKCFEQMSKQDRRSDCPISFGLDLFGDRWTLLIVRDMIFEKKQNFGQFLQAAEGISTNILADRLAMLEQEGIIKKKDDRQHGAKYIYQLTRKGLDLFPIMVEVILWSWRYDKKTKLDAAFIAMIERDKTAFIQANT